MNAQTFTKVHKLLSTLTETISVTGRTLRAIVLLDNHLDIATLHEISRLCDVEVKGNATGVYIIAVIPEERVIEDDSFDEQLVHYLSKGYRQKAIAAEFKRRGILPHHVRTIEKRINDLKYKYNATTLFELAVVISNLKNKS